MSGELFEAEMALAKRLFESMERLDPSPEECNWADLRDCDKEIWRLCIEDLLDESEAYNLALRLYSDSLANANPTQDV